MPVTFSKPRSADPDRPVESAAALTHEDVRRLCGDIGDAGIAAILATDGTVEDLEVALAWIAGEDEVMDEAGRPLGGAAGLIYDILVAGEDLDDDRARG